MKDHCDVPRQPDLTRLGQLEERGMQEHQVLFDERRGTEVFSDFSMGNRFLCKILMK